MSIIRGGSAGFNSVVFYSENFRSKAIRNKNGTISIDISNRKVTPNFEDIISAIPLIRGLYLFLKPVIAMWKIYLIVFIPLIILSLLASGSSESIIGGSSLTLLSIIGEGIQNHFLLLVAIILVVFGVVIKISNLGKYHGAEHMTDTSYNTLSSLHITDVEQQPRVHPNCGTNFVVFLFITFYILSLFMSNFFTLIMLSICLGYEVFLIKSRILTPFYWVGGFLQYTLFTSRPSTKHLEVAIASYEALLKAEETYNKA